jgi:hypothetical protein
MATLEIPADIMLPMIDTEDRQWKIELSNALKNYHIQMVQVLNEIESKLP